MNEKQELYQILDEATYNTESDVIELLREYLKDKKQEIPKHLTSVPLQEQYLQASSAKLFIILRQAMLKGPIYDGGYDNGVQCPYPILMVVDK